MLHTKIHPRILAWLSFCLGLLFFLLFFSWPIYIKCFNPDRSTLNTLAFVWMLLVLTTAVLALICGIAAFWKKDCEQLSSTEKRLARGGLLISGAFLLCGAIVTFLPHRHPSPVPLMCTNELKMAHLVLMLYHLDNNVFPAPSELDALLEKENPVDEYRKRHLDKIEKECPGHHYVYWQPKTPIEDTKQRIPLMADAEPYHKGKRIVIFLDGKVEHLTPEELEALIPK